MADAIKVVVKNTFLEFADEEPQPRILKSKTDTAALRPREEEPRLLDCSVCGLALASANAAAAAARAAAAAAAAACAVPKVLAAGGLPMGFDAATLMQQPGLSTAGCLEGSACETEKGSCDSSTSEEGEMTTVMLRNVPNDYTRHMLLKLLDSSGFSGKYDFVYLPTDFSRRAGLGYAFVNMVSPADAQEVHRQLEGYRHWSVPSSKVCQVGWSRPCQGLEANVERYRNSPIMHDSIPDDFKPMVFVDGARAPFPPPTKKLRKPDMGKHGGGRNKAH